MPYNQPAFVIFARSLAAYPDFTILWPEELNSIRKPRDPASLFSLLDQLFLKSYTQLFWALIPPGPHRSYLHVGMNALTAPDFLPLSHRTIPPGLLPLKHLPLVWAPIRRAFGKQKKRHPPASYIRLLKGSQDAQVPLPQAKLPSLQSHWFKPSVIYPIIDSQQARVEIRFARLQFPRSHFYMFLAWRFTNNLPVV